MAAPRWTTKRTVRMDPALPRGACVAPMLSRVERISHGVPLSLMLDRGGVTGPGIDPALDGNSSMSVVRVWRTAGPPVPCAVHVCHTCIRARA